MLLVYSQCHNAVVYISFFLLFIYHAYFRFKKKKTKHEKWGSSRTDKQEFSLWQSNQIYVSSRISHYPAINTDLIHLHTNVTGSITLSGRTNKNISLFAICWQRIA